VLLGRGRHVPRGKRPNQPADVGAAGSAPRRCGPTGKAADPASVAFEAVKRGHRRGRRRPSVIDTAGRLHTKVGLMDELGKGSKRVVEKRATVRRGACWLLDATTGQNGLRQGPGVRRGWSTSTGIVLTKAGLAHRQGRPLVIAVQA